MVYHISLDIQLLHWLLCEQWVFQGIVTFECSMDVTSLSHMQNHPKLSFQLQRYETGSRTGSAVSCGVTDKFWGSQSQYIQNNCSCTCCSLQNLWKCTYWSKPLYTRVVIFLTVQIPAIHYFYSLLLSAVWTNFWVVSPSTHITIVAAHACCEFTKPVKVYILE